MIPPSLQNVGPPLSRVPGEVLNYFQMHTKQFLLVVKQVSFYSTDVANRFSRLQILLGICNRFARYLLLRAVGY